jgi:hypothetical protein
MRKNLFLMTIAAVSVCVMVACGSKSSSNKVESASQPEPAKEEVGYGEEDAPKTAEGVIAMLKEAYEEVNILTNPSDDESEPNIDLVAEFCSKDFNELRDKMREAEVNGKPGIVEDWNAMWTFWDEGTITPEDFDVSVDGDTAEATFNLTNGDDNVTYCVSLVYEDGQWRVSDWTQRGMDGLSLVERMTEYLEEE